jgi:hypothetical protein
MKDRDREKVQRGYLTNGINQLDPSVSKDPAPKGTNSLDRGEALKLLEECRNLAAKLTEQGMDIELNNRQDRLTLQGFETVWLSGWLEDSELQTEAGLSPAHIATLGYLLAQQQHQIKSGE